MKTTSKDTHIGHIVDDSLDEGLAHYSLLLGVELRRRRNERDEWSAVLVSDPGCHVGPGKVIGNPFQMQNETSI